MGTWGVAIFSDDIASDVRDRYREHLGDGLPDTEATRLERLSFATARDWSAIGHPRLHGVLVLNQRQLDRFALVVEGSEPSDWQMNFVINADDLEGLAERRFGLV